MFKERSPLAVVLLSLVTLGLYNIYWFYDTNGQFKSHLQDGSHPALRTFVMLFPLLNLVAFFKHSKSAEKATGGYEWVLTFLSYLVFPPLAWYLIQSDINEKA